ncbi:hypothetical protein SAMN06265173_101191 [Thalassovita litoralis]|uniref:Uncharacterized protein n=1 Tax=Thalassovita litoralis TaxID=1010611 RepID=A0A521AJ14_9RHOB|nr:hypothetical protein [Thalassovita litoralis]SMO34741.1 hypothetical protein SAMN06265173_101191 [Thalassovita litoralis]
MPPKSDWDALGALFAQPNPFAPPAPPDAPTAPPSASGGECVTYLGKPVPKWLARDLIQERAAIQEYDGGLSRADAQREAAKGLDR